jgi:menaquinol-cytochrome c reductase iron-sulfur subunit
MSDEPQIRREGFLKIAILGIGGFIGVSLGIPALGYIASPASLKDQSQVWIRVGSTSKVEIGTPTLFKIKVKRTTGWIVNEEEFSVYVLTENGRDYIVMSNVCTHLGCRVRWIEEKDQFFCPCHNGVFNKQGEVVSGPPPKPLNQFQVKVEDNAIFVLGS